MDQGTFQFLDKACPAGCTLTEECRRLIEETVINYSSLHNIALIVALIIIAAHAIYNIKEKDYGAIIFDAAVTIFIVAALIN